MFVRCYRCQNILWGASVKDINGNDFCLDCSRCSQCHLKLTGKYHAGLKGGFWCTDCVEKHRIQEVEKLVREREEIKRQLDEIKNNSNTSRCENCSQKIKVGDTYYYTKEEPDKKICASCRSDQIDKEIEEAERKRKELERRQRDNEDDDDDEDDEYYNDCQKKIKEGETFYRSKSNPNKVFCKSCEKKRNSNDSGGGRKNNPPPPSSGGEGQNDSLNDSGSRGEAGKNNFGNYLPWIIVAVFGIIILLVVVYSLDRRNSSKK